MCSKSMETKRNGLPGFCLNTFRSAVVAPNSTDSWFFFQKWLDPYICVSGELKKYHTTKETSCKWFRSNFFGYRKIVGHSVYWLQTYILVKYHHFGSKLDNFVFWPKLSIFWAHWFSATRKSKLSSVGIFILAAKRSFKWDKIIERRGLNIPPVILK